MFPGTYIYSFIKFGSVTAETRLISIVSKPMLIVVVVVVIDVVFLKKILGPKKFWLKNIHVQKKLKQKIFGSKRVWSKKVVVL